MAFTRRSLGALGLSEEQVDKVMALHGTSMSDFIPKSELQEKIDLALADAQKNALQNVKVKETDEYKAVAEIHSTHSTDVRGENAPAIAEQLKTVAEKYEEYFNPTEPAPPPSSPQFGAEVKGQMPSGKTGSTFEDVWGLNKK